MTGYTVDREGNIRLPIVGAINVKDKTIEEAGFKSNPNSNSM